MLLGVNISAFAACAVIVPFACALAVAIAPQRYGRWICIGSSAFASLCCVLAWVALGVSGAGRCETDIASLGGVQILGFVFDRVSVMLAACFVIIGLLISIYSTAYMSPENREHADAPRRRFYAYFTAFVGAMAGLVYSSTVVGQLLFFEITGACSWALIGYYGTPTAQRSALKALILTHVASLGLYVAAGMLYVQTGTFAVSAVAALDDGWKAAVLLCVLFAAWGKSAQLPFYMWLPSAMEAPTPVSAYLHGASMVKVGVAIMARELMEAGSVPEVVGWVTVICAICTMLFSFFMYLPQKDMKRLLAFSTISQLSYIFLGFGFYVFGSDVALQGSLMHMFNHAWAKTLFFLVAGAFSFTLGTRMLPQIRGVIKRQPVLAVSFGVAALAIAGCPPFNGFFSKFAIFSGSFSAAMGNPALTFVVVVALIETVGCFAWFLKWMGAVIPGEPSPAVADAHPVPRQMTVVFVILIVCAVVSSFIAAAWLG